MQARTKAEEDQEGVSTKAVQLFELSDPDITEAFSGFLFKFSNRFQFLEEMPVDILNEYCNKVKDTFTGTSQLTLGFRVVSRKPWIGDDTWRIIEERRILKQRGLACGKEESVNIKETYRKKNKEVKRSAKKDKKTYLEDKATETQRAANAGDSRTLYKITRDLPGSRKSQSTVVRVKEGNVIVKEEDQLAKWAEHFKDVLNRPSQKHKV